MTPDLNSNDLRHRIVELTIQVAVLAEHVAGEERAKMLQAAEYERRLKDLNHAHEQAREVLATYIPRETFDKTMDLVLGRLALLEAWRERIAGTTATAEWVGKALWAVVGGTVIAIIAFAFKGNF